MMRKTGFSRMLAIGFCLYVFSLSCGGDPVSPEDSFHIADYLPLEEGYNRRYSYYYQRQGRSDDGFDQSFTLKCNYKLEVINTVKDGSQTYATVAATFTLTANSNPNYGDTTFTRTFDILQTQDSTWYVTGAPSLDRLNEGTRIPLMFTPKEENNYIDFRLFALDLGEMFKYQDELKFDGLSFEVTGDTLVYHIDTMKYSSPNSGVRATLILVRGLGIRSIDQWDVTWGTSLHEESVTVRLELLE